MREYIIKFDTDTPLYEITAGTTVRAMIKTVGDCDEVIRCKDCKHWRANTQFCSVFSSLNLARRMPPDGYCSEAERKEE